MSHSTRRQFIQFAGTALGTIALGSIESLTQAANLLAQPTGRKYALLIGIDAYKDVRALKGCNTDVDLQRQLLLHRYGFQPADILELRDTNATYSNIINAFQTHLIQQAQPGDTVVFLFSGHGDIVSDRGNTIPEFNRKDKSLNGTIVPIDWKMPESNKVRQIMGKTLFLLSRQLKTDNVVMILDSCHSEGALRGNSELRSAGTSRSSAISREVFQAEIDLQTELQKRLKLTDAELQKQRQQGAAKGVAMGAASFDKDADIVQFEALEQSENGFSAGAFNYLLTRYLWQASGNRSLETDFAQLVLSSSLNSKNPYQNPVYQVAPNSGNATKPIFFAAPSFPAAEGVIHEPPKGDAVKFWLGGASPDCLKAYETAIFNIIDPTNGKVVGELQQTSRKGLVGHGKMVLGSKIQPQVGMLLQEKIRGIPDNLILKIGLDASLGDALPTINQGLVEMPKIEIVPIGQQKEMDYIIGRAKQTGRFHVLTPSLAIVSDPIGTVNASVATVLDELKGYLKTLQAKQLLKTMMGDAATMKISTDLVPVAIVDRKNKKVKVRSIGPAQTIMSQSAITAKPDTIVTAPTFPDKSSVQIRLRNQESKPLHMAVMVISADGSLAVVYPYGIEATDEALIAPNSEKILDYPIAIASDTKAFELLTIASRQPLDRLLKTVKLIADSRSPANRGTAIEFNGDKSIEFAADMLSDIDNISRSGTPSTGKKIVDMNQLTVVSAIVQVQ
jgi:hypothetical protein